MKKDMEARLREALRPVTPREELTQRLIAQVGARTRRRAVRRTIGWLGAVAASLLIAVGAQQHVRAQRELASGMEARRQLLQALALTSQKLDLAYEAVRSQSTSLVDPESGA